MPEFENFVLSAPLGFVNSCKEINNLVGDNIGAFNEIGRSACIAVFNGLPLPAVKTKGERQCVNGIAFLCRSCNQASPAPTDKEIAITLNSATILNRSSIEAFLEQYNSAKEWMSHAEAALASADEEDNENKYETNEYTALLSTSKIGELQSLTWKIGISIVSNQCEELLTPYISCIFTVKNPKGESYQYPCELNYTEFQVRTLFIILYGFCCF